jgi:Pentapeptide repeats (8 copies)
MVRGVFPPTWLKQQCSVLQQRGSAALDQVWKTAAPAGSRGLQTIKDASRKIFGRLRATPWRIIALRYKVPLLVLGGVLLALFLLIIIIKVPQWQAASWRGLPEIELKDLPKLENDARTTLIQAVGGLALLIGLLFTRRNVKAAERASQETLRISQEGQLTERFTRAIEQLGSGKLEIRLGGIYALERIARDSERDYWPIMEVLTAYVRANAPWKEEEEQHSQEERSPHETQPTQSNQSPPELATDIQAILTVLGRRARTFGKGEDQRLDLKRTALRRANLWRAHLEGAGLWGAHLRGADLRGAGLEGAFLFEADLERAFLNGANSLTVEQLATVKTLHKAQLDPPLFEQIRGMYPQLLKLSLADADI